MPVLDIISHDGSLLPPAGFVPVVQAVMFFPRDESKRKIFLAREGVRHALAFSDKPRLSVLRETLESLIDGVNQEPLAESIRKAAVAGESAGIALATVFVLAKEEPKIASLNEAYDLMMKAHLGVPDTPTALKNHWKTHSSVAHMWATWALHWTRVRYAGISRGEAWKSFWSANQVQLLSDFEAIRLLGEQLKSFRSSKTTLDPATTWKAPTGPRPGTLNIPSLTEWARSRL